MKEKRELLQKLRWNKSTDICDLPRGNRKFLVLYNGEVTLGYHRLNQDSGDDDYFILNMTNHEGNCYFSQVDEDFFKECYWMSIPKIPLLRK